MAKTNKLCTSAQVERGMKHAKKLGPKALVPVIVDEYRRSVEGFWRPGFHATDVTSFHAQYEASEQALLKHFLKWYLEEYS